MHTVSATSKRDAVGRKPKRKTFASDGVGVCEKECTQEVIRECLLGFMGRGERYELTIDTPSSSAEVGWSS